MIFPSPVPGLHAVEWIESMAKPAVANGPADQAGAGPARDDRDGRLDGGVNQEAGLLCVGGESDGLRRDLVNRRVGRIELARQIIEGDFAVRTSERYLLLG